MRVATRALLLVMTVSASAAWPCGGWKLRAAKETEVRHLVNSVTVHAGRAGKRALRGTIEGTTLDPKSLRVDGAPVRLFTLDGGAVVENGAPVATWADGRVELFGRTFAVKVEPMQHPNGPIDTTVTVTEGDAVVLSGDFMSLARSCSTRRKVDDAAVRAEMMQRVVFSLIAWSLAGAPKD